MPRKPKKVAKNQDNQINDFQDTLVKRIDECESVLKHLEECPAWVVITRDLDRYKKAIDDNWQDITDDKKLFEMKIIKLAYMQLLNLKDSYKLDLENAQKELHKMQNPDAVINKDYDNA